ncbi:hypothetical protein GCM10010129_56840 [Streptomyces fumigatiscleroticus]|nr:hypothetical protein GCM10010129_56840 [Streptomyces fumigatiscleroticus]
MEQRVTDDAAAQAGDGTDGQIAEEVEAFRTRHHTTQESADEDSHQIQAADGGVQALRCKWIHRCTSFHDFPRTGFGFAEDHPFLVRTDRGRPAQDAAT